MTTARLMITPLALVELAIVAWYFLYWDLFPKWSLRRLVPWMIFMISVGGIPFLQIGIYKQLASVAVVDDPFVALLIAAEGLLSAALMFYLLLRRRSKQRLL
jgi:membrane associated rhomboid family serine protease